MKVENLKKKLKPKRKKNHSQTLAKERVFALIP